MAKEAGYSAQHTLMCRSSRFFVLLPHSFCLLLLLLVVVASAFPPSFKARALSSRFSARSLVQPPPTSAALMSVEVVNEIVLEAGSAALLAADEHSVRERFHDDVRRQALGDEALGDGAARLVVV